jgi:DNA-binding MarR family transcriptional regulator
VAVKKNNNRPDRAGNRKAGNAPKLTAEEERYLLAKQLGLKPKSKQVLDLLLENPKLSQTEAYAMVHGNATRKTAATAASALIRKPEARIYSERAVGKAKRRIVTLVDSKNEGIALKASADILDRTEGKAVQKSENINRTVEVKLDLSGVRIGAHYVKAEQLPAEAE